MKVLRARIVGIRMIGLGNTLRSIFYPSWRDRIERRFASPKMNASPRLVGKALSAEKTPHGALIQFENSRLVIHFLAPDCAQVAWDGDESAPSYGIAKSEWSVVATQFSESRDEWSVRAEALHISVTRDGVIRYQDTAGHGLREELPATRAGIGWTQHAERAEGECIYGLGGRAAPLNRARGDKGPASYRFWNRDPGGAYGPGDDPLYICMPVYLSVRDTGCLLVFHDTSFDGTITIDKGIDVAFDGGPRKTYLITGTPSAILTRFTELTGRPPIPPRWAFGYQHSRWGFGTEREVRRVVQGFRDNNLPLGVLHLDIDHMRGFRTLTTNPVTFPTLAELSKELHTDGTRLVVIVDPGIKTDGKFDLFAQGLKRKAFCTLPDGNLFRGTVWPGSSAFVDYTDPAARAWWGTRYSDEISRGVDGFWHDMNEPACFTMSGSPTFPLCVRHSIEGRGGDHREAHNVFGMLMNRAGHEGLAAERPDRRPFIVTRSGWVGMQRYSWSWTGDVQTSWSSLRMTPAMAIGLGLCGMPYTGSDIGGFSGVPTPELYTRWFQLGSFMPFFRTHCSLGLPQREPWSFGPRVLSIVRGCMQERIRLMPYWYTLAWQAAQTGLPLLRPLFWNEPSRRDLREVDDEFLVGDDLLVAPVLEEGAVSRSVVLPCGPWYPWEGAALEEDQQPVALAAPLEVLPVLGRGGSIIPTHEGSALVLHAFAPHDGASCTGLLYSDDGDGYGPHRVDSFTISPAVGGTPPAFSWTSTGEYRFPYAEAKIVLHGFTDKRVTLEAAMPVKVTIR
jgi:alpha-glucosidase